MKISRKPMALTMEVNQARTVEDLQVVYSKLMEQQEQNNQTALELLGAKVLRLAHSQNEQLAKAQAALEAMQPMNLGPANERAVEQDVANLPMNQLRQQLLANPMHPVNLPVYRLVIIGLLKRLEAAEQRIQAQKNEQGGQGSPPSLKGSDKTPEEVLRHQVVVLEAERHALVQALRIVASGGELDPIVPPSQAF